MAGVSTDDSDEVLLWINPLFKCPDMMGDNERVEALLAKADIIVVHNAPNELANTWGALEQKKACPFKTWQELILKLRCTAAMCRKAGLPFKLETACDTLQLPIRKDRRGKALIDFFCSPDEETGKFNEPRDHPEKWLEFCGYCVTDVHAEKGVGKSLKAFELTGAALATFQFDLRMNQRGIPINMVAARNAQKIIDEVQSGVVTEFRKLTGLNPTQREKVRQLVGLPNMRGPTVEAEIDRLELVLQEDSIVGAADPEDYRRQKILKMFQTLSFAAVKKIQTMLDCACPDGRVRGAHMYYGAGPGRWCLTGDHEVLTFNGWKRLDEWGGEEIACWSPNETVSFQKAKKLQFDFSGELYHQQSQRIDQIATGDHKCPAWNPTTGVFQPRLAKDMVSGVYIPYTGTRDKTARGINPDELRLLVATQADGHYTRDGALRFHFKRERKIVRLKELLRRVEMKWSALKNGDGSTTISILSRHLPLFLHLFRDKTFGSWLLDVNAEVFFEELELWDGYRAGPTSIQYTTVNGTNADWIQALAHTSGMAVSRKLKRVAHKKWRPVHILSIWLSPSNRNQLPTRPTKVKYSGQVYCAKTSTGFFLVRRNGKVWVTGNSSKLLQVQNFRKPDKAFSKMIDGIYHAIRQNWSVAMISEIYGDPLECLANAIRSFIHDPDHEILDGDFNAIEGRIAVWIAGETEILEAWRTGKDLYKRAAAFVEDVPESSILNPSPERNFGKVVELACQFGLGTEGFIRTCAKFGIECDEAKAKRSVHEYYRPTHPKVVARWWQHDSSMREAIRHPGSTFGPFTVRTIAGIPYMLLKLPSGRSIAYPRPMIEIREPTAEEREAMEEGKVFRESRFEQVTYWGEIRPNFYGRIRLWGSKVFENEVQGIAADFMAHGAITAEARGMPPFMLVHDQGLALRTRNQTVAEYEAALGDLPVWAKGFPMRVEAKINPWFKK